MLSTYLNSILGLIVVISLIFTWGNATKIASSATGYPFIQVLFDVTKSQAATSVLTSILIVALTASAIACVATASRQIWAFARDNGVPFSGWVAYVCHIITIRPVCIPWLTVWSRSIPNGISQLTRSSSPLSSLLYYSSSTLDQQLPLMPSLPSTARVYCPRI